ncbi:hypothetical protein E4633_14640 [Geomonas terrae]|uniref:Uncharacterized protein n=1 Tax=Geomonas terrae TaxID=2562681 RepID=A0A4S1CEV1_9BACT|nr:hypothetical protein [Geomonas terrae]TGU71546.1 hypothetical protein E4633_14640 [Geomonas terrae]
MSIVDVCGHTSLCKKHFNPGIAEPHLLPLTGDTMLQLGHLWAPIGGHYSKPMAAWRTTGKAATDIPATAFPVFTIDTAMVISA